MVKGVNTPILANLKLPATLANLKLPATLAYLGKEVPSQLVLGTALCGFTDCSPKRAGSERG